MKKYLITGVSLRSKGGAAMVRSAVSFFPKSNFKIISFFPELDKESLEQWNDLDFEVKPIFLNRFKQISFKTEILFRLFDYLSLLILPRKSLFLSSYSRNLKDVEAVLEIHGISFSKHYGFSDAFTSFLKIKIAKKLGKKYIALPQSYGPIESDFLKKIAISSLNDCELITPRGKISHKLLKTLNIKTRVEFIPDLAFSYENPSDEYINSIKEKYRIENSKPVIAIIPNHLFLNWNAPEVIDYYAEIINSLSSEFSFYLIPHQYAKSGIDDRTFLEQLLPKIKCDYRYFKKQLSAIEIKAILSFCDFSICSRFHGMISSLKMNVTPFVIGWADKYYEIMDLFNLTDNVIDYKDKSMNEFIQKTVEKIKNNEKAELISINKDLESKMKNLETILDEVRE